MKKVLLFVLAIPLLFSCGKSGIAENPYKKSVDSLISIMTIDEKIGQMVLMTSHWEITGPKMSDDNLDEIKSGRIGNVFNAHTAAYTRQLQEIAVNETRLGIPLLFGYDVIHGYKTIFPISLAESASWDLELIEKAARVSAEEASAAGLHWTFAPMVDIARDARWGRVSEGAGEDTYLGSQVARARVRGYQGEDLSLPTTVLACVKHFAAYGAAQAGRDYHTVDISERVLRQDYLPPFKAAIDEGAFSIMTAFNEYDGVPATGSSFLLKQILRDEWGFKGFVVTDYTSINEMIPHGVVADEKEAGLTALEAGVDMDMQGKVYFNWLKTLLDEGRITEKQIDEAAGRILEAKFRLGLFDDPYRYSVDEREKSTLYSEENRKVALEVAAGSMVLLKNENGVLPLARGKNIALIGPLADSKRDLLGSWKAAGEWSNIETLKDALTRMNTGGNVSYIKGSDYGGEDRSEFKDAIREARRADVVVMAMGEYWDWSGEAASRTFIGLPSVQTDLIREITSIGKPVVLVLMNGRAIAIEKEAGMANAILEAWYPGSMGAEAIAATLFGDNNPSGKLPVTFPRNTGQVPIFYNVKNTGRPYEPDGPEQKYRSKYIDSSLEPLFPFGYGLSYTTFEMTDFAISDSVMTKGESMEVTLTLTNTGKIAGAEVVQLYIKDHTGSVTRPLLELKRFEKKFLQPGESAEISFSINMDDLSFYRRDMTFGAESGMFTLFVGPDSKNLQGIQFRLDI